MLNKKHSFIFHFISNSLLIVIIGITTTLASYLIVTGHNEKFDLAKLYTTMELKLPVGQVVALDCDKSGYPYPELGILPASRGLPQNYNYYDGCAGYQWLAGPFFNDIIFWSAVYSTVWLIYKPLRAGFRRTMKRL